MKLSERRLVHVDDFSNDVLMLVLLIMLAAIAPFKLWPTTILSIAKRVFRLVFDTLLPNPYNRINDLFDTIPP